MYLSKVLCLMRKEGRCYLSSFWCINPPFHTHLINYPPCWLHNNNTNPSVRSWRVTSWRSTSSWRWDAWAPPQRTSPRRWCGWRTVTRGPSSWTCSTLQVRNAHTNEQRHQLYPITLKPFYACSRSHTKLHHSHRYNVQSNDVY